MEDLISQMRVKFSGVGQEKAAGSSSIPRDRRVPIQKTQSFKGDKRSQNWFGRQFSRQMSGSPIGPSPVDELSATAVAAAAFVVNALEDSKGTVAQRPTSIGPQRSSSLTKAKSKKDKASPPPEPAGASSPQRPSGEVSTKSQGSPEIQATRPPNLQKRPTFADQLSVSDKADTRSPKIPTPPPPPPPPRRSQSTKKPTAPRFPANSSTMRPEVLSPNPENKPPTPSSQPQPKATSGSTSRGGTTADVWETTEMEKIKERYEKLNATIASWEEGKKKKARAKLDNTESELARRRTKAMEKFKEEMESINQIAGGARAQAEERRRNEELKAKEKANKYKITGKFPKTCFCF